MPRYCQVLFDLDGTLIDSAPAILASYREAFAATARAPVITIDDAIVGPPLLETLQMLAGTEEPAVIDALAAAFKASYDSEGYKQTAAYAGVGTMLEALKSAGFTPFARAKADRIGSRRPVYVAGLDRREPLMAARESMSVRKGMLPP